MRGLAMLAAIALAGCAATVEPPPVTSMVTPSLPAQTIPIEEQQVLFWDDATRRDRFARMEDFFPGQEVAPSSDPRELPERAMLPPVLAGRLTDTLLETGGVGMVVLKDGALAFEAYASGIDADTRWTSFSMAKSVTSTLLGAAVKDGHVALGDMVSQHVPALRGSAYDAVSVEQLATMTSGVAWNEDYGDPASDVARMFAIEPVAGEPQIVTYMKALPRAHPPGERFVYKTGETNLIGVLVEQATGMTLAEYAAEKIVEPAGFEDPLFWMADLTGGSIGGCCLSLTARDYARFGQFVMEGGGAGVPQGWIAEATGEQVSFDAPGFGYGYQWWVVPGGYAAQGIFGQSIVVLPAERLIVATIGNWSTPTSTALRARHLAIVSEIADAVR